MARTPGAARWERVPLTAPNPYPRPGPPQQQHEWAAADESPIYDRLAREWSAAGRTLPGAADGEWAALTRCPPPAGPAPRWIRSPGGSTG
ncbi:hypothetical protein [Streptomyces sp. NPDC020141]|uniref:hypothetical protein n=1 Tax=Streptomyces sp. NPDC020141 TaxID=3365065 RepID=UPI003787CA30